MVKYIAILCSIRTYTSDLASAEEAGFVCSKNLYLKFKYSRGSNFQICKGKYQNKGCFTSMNITLLGVTFSPNTVNFY